MRLAIIWVAMLLAACGSTPKERYYTLSFAEPPEAVTPLAITVAIATVTLPDAVDRTPMVVRTGPNQVDIDDFNRWAEPLKSAIPRAIAGNLARELGNARVTSGRHASANADYRVAIDVRRFESSFNEGATLEAAWTVTGKAGSPFAGTTVAREAAPSADYAGIAAAHSRALDRLAREIAAAITSRGPATPRPRAPT
jgi:uncharacterized lipoprotein YmbA